MQRPDDNKRRDILKVAEKLFASRPFHEVKLDDIAARAKIGKGTIYIYFDSKEAVYMSLLREGLQEQIGRLSRQLCEKTASSRSELHLVIDDLVTFAAQRPGMFQLIRAIQPHQRDGQLAELRGELVRLIEGVIRRGIARGEFVDSRPAITAQLIISSVRGGMLHLGGKVDPAEVTDQISRIFTSALLRNSKDQ